MSDTTAPNPYAAPSSNLQETPSGQVPTIAEALSRGYDFNIGDLISESWQRVKGTKGIIFGGFVIFYIVMSFAFVILSMVFSALGILSEASIISGLSGQLLFSLTSAMAYPFLAGVNLVGIRRAADQTVSFNDVFKGLGLFVPLLITALLMNVLVALGMILLVIPGIYLSIAYILAIPLVIERGLSPWEALETSRKAITQHWFKVFGLFIVLGLIMLVSMIPLGIGLIWTLPLCIITIGALYRTIFGVLPASN
ncbi:MULTISPECIES: hypothetical protein [unclassified Pseudomonas]|uniref:hypothetical protein n=1 Tax=unclassified Pseudomonas TaxID=196821 RepID=UPI002447F82B|nr:MULTISPECIES: hypothetical protein [unclassified Pseudomonas]MDH0896406.1 hypothetical protein [Pseudomonas sp. GD03875]MDH1066773.1 hypothetical protein [Pseudomonas sp. GD03985]